jgi:hypothetical protein
MCIYLISLPPQVTISRLMRRLGACTAPHLLAEFAKYIAEQNIDQDDDFKVDG